ncbi:MAG: hypothetical protein U0892_20930 [Pirellulales bacterium]
MQSWTIALVSEGFRRGSRVALALLVLAFTPCLLYASLPIHPSEMSDAVKVTFELVSLPATMMLVAAAAANIVGDPSKLFLKPLTNFQIAAWQCVSGSLLVSAQMVLVAVAINAVYQARWPTLGAAFYMIALWFAAQPMIATGTKSLRWLAVSSMPIIALFVWFGIQYGMFSRDGRHSWSEVTAVDCLTLLLSMMLTFSLTIKAVASNRCGDASIPTSWSIVVWNWWEQQFHRDDAESMKFKDGSAAYLWHERKWKRWLLPLSTVALLAFGTVGTGIESYAKGTTWLPELAEFGFVLAFGVAGQSIFVGLFVGASFNNLSEVAIKTANREGRIPMFDEITSFYASLPISDHGMAQATTRVLLSNYFPAWMIWCAMFGCVFTTAQFHGVSLHEPLRSNLRAVPLMACLSWCALAGTAAVMTFGDSRIVIRKVITLILSGFAIILFTEVMGYYVPLFAQIAFVIEVAIHVVISAFLAGLLFGAIRRSVRLRMIGPREISAAAFFLISSIAAFLPLAPSLQTGSWVWYTCDLILGTTLPIFFLPHAVYANRHR